MAKGGGLAHSPGYLYLIKEVAPEPKGEVYYKIGGSANPDARLKELQTGNPRKLWDDAQGVYGKLYSV